MTEALFFAETARAENYFEYNPVPNCILQQAKGPKWEAADASLLAGKKLLVQPYGSRQEYFTTRSNGVWFFSRKECFRPTLPPQGGPSQPPVAAAPTPVASPNPALTPEKKVWPKTPPQVGKFWKRPFSIDIQGSYLLMQAKNLQESQAIFSGTSATMKKMSGMTGVNVRLGYLMSKHDELNFGIQYDTGNQSGEMSGISGGTIAVKYTLMDFKFGYRYLMKNYPFIPFAGLTLGFGSLSSNYTFTGGSIGDVNFDAAGTGITIAVGGGAYYYFSERFRFSADIEYKNANSSSMMVKTSSAPATVAIGADLGPLTLTHYAANLGFGYCF